MLIAADIQDLCLRIGIAPEEAGSLDALSFLDDDGTFAAPWAVTERFARRAAAAIADELLNWVSDREREAQEKAIYGKDYGGRGGSGYVSAETLQR